MSPFAIAPEARRPTEQFPFLSHRTLREVGETDELKRRWEHGENLSPADRKRLAQLLDLAQAAGEVRP